LIKKFGKPVPGLQALPLQYMYHIYISIYIYICTVYISFIFTFGFNDSQVPMTFTTNLSELFGYPGPHSMAMYHHSCHHSPFFRLSPPRRMGHSTGIYFSGSGLAKPSVAKAS
jgi:hypothetical protein